MTVEELAEHNHRSGANCLIWAPKNDWDGSIANPQVSLGSSATGDGPVFMDRTLKSAGLWYSEYAGNNVAHNNMQPYSAVYIFKRSS